MSITQWFAGGALAVALAACGSSEPPPLVPAESPLLDGVAIFPPDNPWNTPVDAEPVDPNSAALLASIGLDTGLHPDFGADWDGGPFGIPYVVVGGAQALMAVTFEYADESDPGP